MPRITAGISSSTHSSGRPVPTIIRSPTVFTLSSGVPTHQVAAGLAGYLCGTNVRLSGSNRWFDPEDTVASHRLIVSGTLEEPSVLLGDTRWSPTGDEAALKERLLEALNVPGVVDLVIFGSQARGGATGYSDLDAILILDDVTADDAHRLRVLRPRVLAAQRAVLAYQPMQHHGFLVATPRLLSHASVAFRMPKEAVATTVSLCGTRTKASFATPHDPYQAFRQLAASLLAIRTWPRNPWVLHGRLSTFELLPALYLQATGRPTEKHESFRTAAQEFSDIWWPYDILEEVRLAWPRTRRPMLEMSARLAGNPWFVVAAWRRLPLGLPGEIGERLTDACLAGLRVLVSRMVGLAS